mmetsp:Transcript_13228/g.21505  ORF Transcript_13228/g.21505 Transcript_13228/m.21505 type:complete len:268 (-) Transcript_13228:2507-3310(-)
MAKHSHKVERKTSTATGKRKKEREHVKRNKLLVWDRQLDAIKWAVAILALLGWAKWMMGTRTSGNGDPGVTALLRGTQGPTHAKAKTGTEFYFAYASDLSQARVRSGSSTKAKVITVAKVGQMTFDYTIFSKVWRGGVADLVKSEKPAEAWGVVYEFPKSDIPKLDKQKGIDNAEPKYKKIRVLATSKDGKIQFDAFTYNILEKQHMPDQSSSTGVKRYQPSIQYRNCIIKGAKEAGLPQRYIDSLIAMPDNGENYKRKSVGTSCDL